MGKGLWVRTQKAGVPLPPPPQAYPSRMASFSSSIPDIPLQEGSDPSVGQVVGQESTYPGYGVIGKFFNVIQEPFRRTPEKPTQASSWHHLIPAFEQSWRKVDSDLDLSPTAYRLVWINQSLSGQAHRPIPAM